MATSDEEENIYTKPGAIRRGGNSSTAVGFYSRGVQPTDVQTSDDYSPPSNPDPVVLPGTGESDDSNTDPDTDATGSTIDNPRFIDVDPTVQTLTRVASLATPTPIGLAAGAVQAGINVNNLDWANAQRERLGLEKLGGWETVKAAAGFSDYTDGKVGTVDISGKQREVTYGGGLVGDGPDVERRTAMTPAEALARQASARSITRTDNQNSDRTATFGTPDDARQGRGFNSDFSSIRSDSNGSGGGNERDQSGTFGTRDDARQGRGYNSDYSGMSGGSQSSGQANSGGDGGGGGGGSSRVICTELYRQGLISREDWLRDLRYTSEHLSRQHVRGYHYWAIPTVRKMRVSKNWTSVWRIIGQARANQIAYLMGDRSKPDLFGVFAKVALEGFCWVVGFFVGDRDAAAELSDGNGANQ